MRSLIFLRMVVHKERINEKGLYIFVEWSYAIKRNKSIRTLYYCWMHMHIALAKISEHKGSVSPSSFYRQQPDYYSHVVSLIYPVNEFSFEEMKTWRHSKISSYCFCVWWESRELGSRGSWRFPCINPVPEASSDRVTFKTLSNILNGAPL